MKKQIVLSLSLILAGSPSAFGQWNTGASQSQTNQSKQTKPATQGQSAQVKTRQEEFATTELRQPPALADMPEFTGTKKFQHGFAMPNTYGGPTYELVFHTKEDAPTVLSWYSQALQTTGWKLGRTDSDTVCATNKTGRCEISVTQFRHPDSDGLKAQLIVTYRVTGPRQ